jgi:hypothetical protein
MSSLPCHSISYAQASFPLSHAEEVGAVHSTSANLPILGSYEDTDEGSDYASSSGNNGEDDPDPNDSEEYFTNSTGVGESYIDTFSTHVESATSVFLQQYSLNAYTTVSGGNSGSTSALFEFVADGEQPPLDPETERLEMTGLLDLDFTFTDPVGDGSLQAYAGCGSSWISLESPGTFVGLIGYFDENNDFQLESVSGSGYSPSYYFVQPIGPGSDFELNTYASVSFEDYGPGSPILSSGSGTATAYVQPQVTQF